MITMKKLTLLLLTIILVTTTWAQGPNGSVDYYGPADKKKGAELKTALCNIIYKHVKRDYDQLWEDFKSTDKFDDGTADGRVWDMYSVQQYTFGAPYQGNGGLEGAGYNREHSFPKSWFFEGAPMYTDLFHLYPTDCWVNSLRNNHPDGEIERDASKPIDQDPNTTNHSQDYFSRLGYAASHLGYDGGSEQVFEPNDEYKGDLARTYFYMVTCYENEVPTWDSPMTTKGESYNVLRPWALKMLMRWSKNDPVSQKEIDRNNAVYEIQENRNPFIDYPGLEDYIWGDLKETAFDCGFDYTPPVEDGQRQFVKVTSADDLELGKSYLFVYEKSGKAMAGRTDTKNYLDPVDVGTIYTTGLATQVNVAGKPHTFLLGGTKNAYTFLDEADNTYLALQRDDQNQLITSATATSDKEKWTVTTFESSPDVLQVQNNAYTERYIWYNEQNTRFASYKSSSLNGRIHYISLFKDVTPDTPTGIISINTNPSSPNSHLSSLDSQLSSLYNLAGQRVSDSYRGIVIKNGRKIIKK